MMNIAMHEFEGRLGEYMRRIQDGEEINITSQGKVVAELRPPRRLPEPPAGLEQLLRKGIAREIVRNDPEIYQPRPRLLKNTSLAALLNEDRGER